MDAVLSATGAAVVRAISQDNGDRLSQAVVELWQRFRPHEAAGIEADLMELRQAAAEVGSSPDASGWRALEGLWRLRFRQLAQSNSAGTAQLLRFLDQRLAPLLAAAEREAPHPVTLEARASGHAVVFQAGRDQRVTYRDSDS
ncbi:hypothetical protein [Streptomyces chartreusis]|uniref:hypothetical protein n=1 Tax=Streptomyces chartreusis TaxID=1969 RepID=UPI00123DAC8A|nr:hypothetical protein [Streptomyces chartreusis]QEV69347.1 hypothetical protein CP983_23595 [Streptomyces chartreusis]GGX18575.1 hypothetical protein GCM10010321_36460 [Streptomyces chartreusis]